MSGTEPRPDGEIRLFWIVLWAISVAFAVGIYRPNWEALERKRTARAELLVEIERSAEENARLRAGVELLGAGDPGTWERVIRQRYSYVREGEIPCPGPMAERRGQ